MKLVPRRAALISTVVGLVVGALAFLVEPAPHRLGGERSGNRTLAERVLDAVGDSDGGYRGLSVARVEKSGTVTAMLGDDAGGPLFEVGSVGKLFTGMVFADLIADGTVRADDRLRTAFPLADSRVGEITFAELASHRSGLPRLGGGPGSLLADAWTNVTGGDPYDETVDDVLQQAAEASVGSGRGEVHYSNFGMALLGQALAARTGTPYPELVAERILRPLGMSDTSIGGSPTDRWASGATASGRNVAAWSSAGYAPAGIGVRSTAADLAKLVAATRDGTAPGADAATPRWEDVGYAWFTDDQGLTWHNGATGGFRSYVGYDRASGEGVVVLGNTNRDVEWIGIRLLGGEAPRSDTTLVPWQWAVTVFLLLYLALTPLSLALARPGKASWWQSAPDRLRVVQTTLATVAVALLAHRLGDWLTVPPLCWALGVGIAAGGAALAWSRWRDLPTSSGRHVRLRRLAFAASALASVVVIVLV